jgi:hypothetical protein
MQIKDLRPDTEKQGEIFSLLITSEAYAITRVAENAFSPPAVRLLQHRAFEKFGAATPMPELKIHHLVVYTNPQAQFRRMAIGAGIGGAIGAVVGAQMTTDSSGVVNTTSDSKAFESVSATEYKRAWYTEQENPGRGNVIVIYIETEIQGKRVFTKSIAAMTGKAGENPVIVALESGIKYHFSQY